MESRGAFEWLVFKWGHPVRRRDTPYPASANAGWLSLTLLGRSTDKGYRVKNLFDVNTPRGKNAPSASRKSGR
jgi:hypothetical protein